MSDKVLTPAEQANKLVDRYASSKPTPANKETLRAGFAKLMPPDRADFLIQDLNINPHLSFGEFRTLVAEEFVNEE